MTVAAPRAFHVMAKPTGAIYNLDCHYWPAGLDNR